MTMREKMARAMCKLDGRILGDHDTNTAWYFERVDAALDALMEPTEGMVSAYDKTGWPHDDGPEMPLAYQNMIRAAKEGK